MGKVVKDTKKIGSKTPVKGPKVQVGKKKMQVGITMGKKMY